MNDQQLSEQLRRSQRIRRICLPVMGFCFPGGLVAGVWFRNLPVYLVLTFGGAGGAFWLRHHIRKRNRKLIDEHLKDFYKEELERVFGSKRHTPELAITKEVVQANGFMEGEWEECRVENEYEGVYRGHPFSAANISLYHVYRRKVDQGYSIERKEVFQGIWLIGRMAHQDRCLAVETKVKFAEVPDEDISDMTKLRQGFCYCSNSSQTLAVRLRTNLIQGVSRLLLRSKTFNEPANRYWNEVRVNSNNYSD